MAQDQAQGAESGKAKKKGGGRFKVGLIFSIAVLVCVIGSDISTTILMAALAALCCFELCGLLRSDSKIPNEWLGIACAALYPFSYFWFGAKGMLVLTLLLMVIAIVWYVGALRTRITDVGITVFSALYTGLLLTSFVVIRSAVPGVWGGVFTALIIVSIWANDTMAFVWGSRLGRHRLAPRISPKKSWEGCVAGIVGSVVIWELTPFVPGIEITFVTAAICAVVTGVFSIAGDLAESRIKRAAGMKDSGTLLQGHGGFFDRCDAMILGGAAAVACLIACGVIPMI